MRRRGLSRVTPQERRRRLFILGALALVVGFGAAGTWWVVRRPVLDDFLNARIPAAIGGETRLRGVEPGLRGATIAAVEHRRQGWEVAAEALEVDASLAGLRAGRLDALAVDRLAVTRTGPGPDGPLLPALAFPVDHLLVREGSLSLPGLLPGPVAFGVVAAPGVGAGTVHVNVAARLDAATRVDLDVAWLPEAAGATVRLDAATTELRGLVAALGENVPGVAAWTEGLPGGLVARADGVVDLVDGELGPWGGTLSLGPVPVRVGERTFSVEGAEVAVQGRGSVPAGFAAGVRLAAIREAGLVVTPGVVAARGPASAAGPWEVEVPSLLVEGELAGQADPARRLRLSLVGEVLPAGPDGVGSPGGRVVVAVAEPWRWAGFAGEPFRASVEVDGDAATARVEELRVVAPVQLGLVDVDVTAEGIPAAPKVDVAATLDVSRLLPDWVTWEGALVPVVASVAPDRRFEWFMPAFAIDTALTTPAAAVVFRGELGQAWVHGSVAEGIGSASGEFTATAEELEVAGGTWRLSRGEATLRLAVGSLGPLLETAWRSEGIPGALATLGRAGVGLTLAGSFAEVGGDVAGTTVTLGDVRWSVGHAPEAGAEAVVEARRGMALGVRLDRLRASLAASAGGTLAATMGATVFDDAWPLRLAAEPVEPAAAAGPWRVLAELGPVERGMPVPLPRMPGVPTAGLAWSGRIAASWAGTVDASGEAVGVLGLGLEQLGIASESEGWSVEGVDLEAQVAAGSDAAAWATVEPARLVVGRIEAGGTVVEDLAVSFGLAGRQVAVEEATARWLGGLVRVRPFRWSPDGGALDLALEVEALELGEVAALVESLPFAVSGRVVGSLSLRWRDGGIQVQRGRLALVQGEQGTLALETTGWLTSRAAPGTPQHEALALVERAAQDLVVDRLEVLIEPEGGEKPVRLSIAGRSRDPAIEAPIQLDVNLDLDLDDWLNNRLWRSLAP